MTECYGIHHLSMERKDRREKLKRGYMFDCACQVKMNDFCEGM